MNIVLVITICIICLAVGFYGGFAYAIDGFLRVYTSALVKYTNDSLEHIKTLKEIMETLKGGNKDGSL